MSICLVNLSQFVCVSLASIRTDSTRYTAPARGWQMSRRRRTKKPTPWQFAKPHIRKIVGAALDCHGFKNAGVTMLRYRPVFMDVIHVRSEHGNDYSLHFGCHIRSLLEGCTPPGRSACLLKPARIALRSDITPHTLPDDPACLPGFIESIMLPQVSHIVETWFPQFTDIDSAIQLLEGDAGIIQSSSNVEFCCLMMLLQRAKQPSMTTGESYRTWTESMQRAPK